MSTSFNENIASEPSSVPHLEEAIELILKLYQPGASQEVNQIQETLLRIQHSKEGWQLADALLANGNEKIRFFGALTLTVKLNSDWQTLAQQDAEQLLGQLIFWFIKLTSQLETHLVLKKLCGTLVTFFLKFSSIWEPCICHLLCSLREGRIVSIQGGQTSLSQEQTNLYLDQLTHSQNSALLWFVANIVDEAQKIERSNVANQDLLTRVQRNAEQAAKIIRHHLQKSLSQNGSDEHVDSTPGCEAIKALHSWVSYCHKAFVVDSGSVFTELKDLMPLVIAALDQDNLFESATECLTDALTNFTVVFRKEHIDTLFKWFSQPRAEGLYNTLLAGDSDFEPLAFGGLLLALAESTIQDLARTIEQSGTLSIMQKLHGLLCCPGYPIADDEICSSALEFWSAFVEHMADSLFEDESALASWMRPARGHLIKVIEECWAKIHLRPKDVLVSWDTNTKTGFKSFRKDTADVLQSSYTFLGVEIFSKLVDLVIQSLAKEAWVDTEATLYFLNSLSDSIAFDDEEEASLSRLFDSPFFGRLSDPSASVPGKLCHSAVTLVGNYASFFEKHRDYLPAALNFLFGSLESPAQAQIASKSIQSLCLSCRSSLVNELETFIAHYHSVLQVSNIEAITRERILGAIAAVIQALPSDEAKINPLERLVGFLEEDSQILTAALAERDIEKARHAGTSVLQSLVGIGRGLQEPDDVPLDLESDSIQSTFWSEGQGSRFQQRVILATENIFNLLSGDGDVVEAACILMRTGLTERVPGPFVFPPMIVARFVTKCSLSTPRIGQMPRTGCSLITAYSSDSSVRIDAEAKLMLRHMMLLTKELGGPENDPEIAQWAVEYFTRLMPRYLNVLIENNPPNEIEEIFIFTLRCLSGADHMPKRSSSVFWTTFLGLSGLPVSQQNLIDQIMLAIGPLLGEVLMNGIGGDAARSEIDMLCNPLKKLVVRHQLSKRWLEQALKKSTFPSDKVSEKNKELFLVKVIGLRGGSQTFQIAKDFWLACRGSNFAYAS